MLLETYLLITAITIGTLSLATALRVAYRQNQMFDELDDFQQQINFLNEKIEAVKQLEQITSDY